MQFIKLSKKKLIFVIIILIILLLIILTHINLLKSQNQIKNQYYQKSYLSSDQLKQPNLSKDLFSSKLKINNYDNSENIESYIFSKDYKNINKFLDNITEQDKSEIQSIKKLFLTNISEFNYINDLIKNYQNEVIKFQNKLEFIPITINSLEQKIQELQANRKKINNNINIKKIQQQNKQSELQTQGITVYNNQEINNLKKQIAKLISQKEATRKQISILQLNKQNLQNLEIIVHQKIKLYQDQYIKLTLSLNQKFQFYMQKFFIFKDLYINSK
ncbi:MAG: hypothetical protein Q8889_02225 [Candidatus Phytoplasma australasiaticum]|nr:hypothetical protein [Candidatus Phytoplasma australasiaticum]MDV3199919.1 hypothetical protein [Candidatus Phytoplasma australasiaticum]